MDKQKATEILLKRIDEWSEKPKTDGYEYEKSFIEVMQGLNEELFQLSVGELPKDRNEKKNGAARAVQTQIGDIEVKKGHIMEPKGAFRQSPYLQDTALYLGQGDIFSHSSALLTRLTGISLSDKQIENLCHHYGEKIDTENANNQEVTTKKDTDLHYAMVDGSYIMTRVDSWKEVKLGRIFKASDNYALSEKRKTIKDSTYVAHLGECTDFVKKFEMGIVNLVNVVCIADGATWFWKWLTENYPYAIQILDFWHGYEKIGQWATTILKDKEKCSAWCESVKELLLNNEIGEVIIQIQNTDCQGDSLCKKEALLTYLENNQHRMKYKTYLSQGYLIGSGAIESAQRNVIQQRLKRSGQRWTIKGGQQVLNIRTAFLSNNWAKVQNYVRNAA